MIRQFVITLADSAAELCTTLIRRELADSATGGVSPGEFFLLEVCSVSYDLGSGCELLSVDLGLTPCSNVW